MSDFLPENTSESRNVESRDAYILLQGMMNTQALGDLAERIPRGGSPDMVARSTRWFRNPRADAMQA
jgi:hypothetical protein